MVTINEVCTWGLISLIRHTGIRLHEALKAEESHLSNDFTRKNLLEVLSDKSLTDRYIPVSIEVVNAIKKVSEATKQARKEMGTEKIFVNVLKSKKARSLLQNLARLRLKNFIEKYNIVDQSGDLVSLTFHQFRHTIGTDLLNNGMSMTEVKEYLGHESLHSTRLYAKVQNDRLSKEYRKLGFIGVIEEAVDNIKDEQGGEIKKEPFSTWKTVLW